MKFSLQPNDRSALEKIVSSGMTPVIISKRAMILLKKAENKSSKIVAQEMLLTVTLLNCGATNTATVCLNKPFMIFLMYHQDVGERKK